MAMRVNASALAVGCLINAVLDSPASHKHIDEQLELLLVDADWLRSVADRYLSYWQLTLGGFADGETATVDEHAVLLLSWLLAPVKDADSCAQINAKAFAMSSTKHYSLTGVELPALERISVTVGVVGRPVPVIDRDFPVWFPGGVLDGDVELAYAGLLEHVAEAPSGVWPEVYRTAVLWRLGGIAQGLTGGDDDLWECMKQLNRLLVGSLPTAYRRMTADEWLKTYRDHRNVLTHVRPVADLSFADALSSHREPSHLLDYVRLSTFYAAVSINERISGIDPENARRWLDVVDNDQAWVNAVA